MLAVFLAISKSQAGLMTITDKAYLNITIDNYPVGQVVIGLYGQTAPKTVANFLAFAAGTPTGGYKGSAFHRIIKNFVVQGGDFVNGDGTGFQSIYGPTYPDEPFLLNHTVGCVNMANKGPNTNGCQFSIILTKADWLNGRHIVFGTILEGMNLVHKMENLPTNGNDHPIPSPVIAGCGVIKVPVPYDYPLN